MVIEDERITEDSILNAIYVSIFDVAIESVVINTGVITLIFEEQEEDMSVRVIIDSNSRGEGLPGADGQDGIDGQDGKSAYQYAQDGGYEGTEEEFAELLGGLSNTVSDITTELNTKATITSGTTDLTAGTSELASGTIYCVYE